MSDALQLTLLLVDDQAARGAGRKRGRSDEGASSAADGRFVSIGGYSRAVILHRSRRQHYNAVVIGDKPVVELEQLQASVRSLWPNTMLSGAEKGRPAAEAKEDTSPDANLGDGNVDLLDAKPSSASNGDESTTQSATMESKPPPKASRSLDGAEPNAQSTAAASKPSQASLGNFYCGCAGFSSSSWVGNFNLYPKSIVGHNSDRQLAYYQQHFRTVEINSTFYGIPAESTVIKWKGIFAKSFRVVMKAPKGLTHEGSELNCSVLSTFLTRMQPLGDALACILIQCPRTLKVTTSQLERLKAMLDKDAGWYHGRIAFEFRNEATYFDEEVRAFLRQNAYALVMHPNSVGRSTVGTSTSGRSNCDLVQYQPEQLSKVADVGDAASNFVYLRLHGHNDEHTGCYSIEELQEIAEQIHVWRKKGIEVFCFVLNDLEPTSSSSPTKTAKRHWDRWSAMPKNCKQLETLVFGLSSEDIPDAPKKPKNTLMGFFGKK